MRFSSSLPVALGALIMLSAGCKDTTQPEPVSVNPPTSPPPAPTRGSIHVSFATTGTDLDPDGYALVVADVTRRVGASDTVTILDLVPGTHIVRIQGIAMNCASAGGSERSVLVESGRQSVTQFAVSCVEWPSPPELAEAELAGTQLLFVRERRIYRTRFDGTGLLVVTENAYAPAWSPDRSHVAFGRGWSGFDSRQPDRWELCIARADGSDARCTTGPAAGYLVGPPSWSPDGSKVAFSLWLPSCPGGNCGQFGGSYSSLHVLDTSTMTVEVLATPQVTSVSWSPNGRKIAFTAFGVGDFGRGALGVVNPDGSGVNILAGSLGEYSMNQVAWSPDGRKLAFVLTNEEACPWFCDMAIATIDASMGNAYATSLRVLATTRHSDETYLSRLSWAPDGTRIAYTREDCSAGWDPCRYDVFVVAAGGGPVTLLLPGAGQPSWGR